MKTASKWLVLSLIVFLGISMAAALMVSVRIESELNSRSMPLQDAAMMTELELSRFQFELEEYVYEHRGGIADVQDIWKHLEKAEWLGNTMLAGGTDEEWTYIPLGDNGLRSEIISMNQDLVQVHSLAEKIMGMKPGSSEIIKADSEFDALLGRANAKVGNVEHELHRAIRDKQTENSRIVGGILLLCALFTTSAAAVTFGYISAGKRAEDKLAKARTFLQDVIDGVDEPIMAIDTEYNVSLMNKAARKLSAGTEDVGPWHCHEILHDRGKPCLDMPWTCTLQAVLDSGRTLVHEHEHFDTDGKTHRLEIVASPWRNSDGGIKGVIACARDVSERRKLERQRADFYAMVTHDIKSPLTAITGYAEMILDKKSALLDTETADMLTTIHRAGEKLQRLVLDFLSVSQMEAGMLKIKPGPVDIAGLLRETCAEMEKVFRVRGLEFETEMADDLPRRMLVDQHLFQRAVANLLINAAEYTPSGGAVELKARRLSGEGVESVEVSVTDNGPGIPVEEQARIFDKYYRSPRTAGIKGSGLGLAIVKTVARSHGGNIELESEPGKGSTFRLSLPIRPAG